jgi:hypothetical protein
MKTPSKKIMKNDADLSRYPSTPNLSALLQEVVNRGDYLETGAIAILIEGTGRRVAESFDGEADKAPVLRVEYRLIRFDCPENEADIGAPCDDGDPCTVNDAYDGDCHL